MTTSDRRLDLAEPEHPDYLERYRHAIPATSRGLAGSYPARRRGRIDIPGGVALRALPLSSSCFSKVSSCRLRSNALLGYSSDEEQVEEPQDQDDLEGRS